MRTKTLLLAGALSLAGLATSLAQSNVYSLNVVGYVNQPLVTGYTMVGNPLNNTSGGNNVDTLFGQNLPNGSTIFAFSGGGFVSTTYASKSGRWDAGTNAVNPSLAVGGGVFVKNNGAATNVTFVGEVQQGSLSTPYVIGYNIISSKVPQQGLIQTDLGYVPNNGDTVYQFDTAAQNYVKVSSYASKSGTWGGTGQPNLGVAEAVWLKANAAGNWTRNFTVQ